MKQMEPVPSTKKNNSRTATNRDGGSRLDYVGPVEPEGELIVAGLAVDPPATQWNLLKKNIYISKAHLQGSANARLDRRLRGVEPVPWSLEPEKESIPNISRKPSGQLSWQSCTAIRKAKSSTKLFSGNLHRFLFHLEMSKCRGMFAVNRE